MSETTKPKLKVKKSLALEQFVKYIIKTCVENIKELEFENGKIDSRLIRDVMNFIESLISESKFSSKNIDKEELLIEIWKTVFDINESEEKVIRNHIHTAIEDGTIKKKSTLRKVLKKVITVLRFFIGV